MTNPVATAAGGPSLGPVPVLPGVPGSPVRVRIPSLGIDSTLDALGLLPDGSLQPPRTFARAGWYAAGVIPGQVGPAVIAGHVDSRTGPAVFFRLREVRVGAEIDVVDSAGRSLRFQVDTVRSYPKDRFPSAAVYGPTPLAELRVITCTGDFDYAARSYLDNLVVSAHLL